MPLLSVSDVFLLPSAQESFGLAALEAMACGVPVVASRVGGLPEVIEHGVSGYLHPPDALDEMAASAVMLLSDRELHRATGEAARRRVSDAFCAEQDRADVRGARAHRRRRGLVCRDAHVTTLQPLTAYLPRERHQLLERRQHPAVAVRVGDDRRAIAPGCVFRIADAGAGFARPPSARSTSST